jgi:TRAP-type transport system periplasmic protein
MIKKRRIPGWLIVLTLAASLLAPGEAAAKTTMIKTALITPEGSTWTNTLYEMAKEVETQTNGEVAFKIYAGGISGDEMDVLRKMQVNRIHAAGFSGVGLGILVPEIRVLEAPLLFKNHQEIDWVKEQLYCEFSALFAKKGYVLLGFAEAGFVYFFSKTDISDPNGLSKVKMWAWKGDPVAETFLKTFNIKTYPLHLTDVNTGLETGMIDSFYSPTLAAIAFQWFTRIQYMLDYPMVNSTGAFLLRKSVYDKLSEKNQNILKRLAGKYTKKLIALTRKDNADARGVLEESGIEFLSPAPEQIVSFERNARKTYEKNMPQLYSKELFDKVLDLLKGYRANNP